MISNYHYHKNFEKQISNCRYNKNLEQKISDWYNDIFIMDIVILSQKYESGAIF
jgi:hypothetical protein